MMFNLPRVGECKKDVIRIECEVHIVKDCNGSTLMKDSSCWRSAQCSVNQDDVSSLMRHAPLCGVENVFLVSILGLK